jgi:hypothetical protein
MDRPFSREVLAVTVVPTGLDWPREVSKSPKFEFELGWPIRRRQDVLIITSRIGRNVDGLEQVPVLIVDVDRPTLCSRVRRARFAPNLLKYIDEGDIVLGDRAFCSYEFISRIMVERKGRAVMRLHQARHRKLDWHLSLCYSVSFYLAQCGR